MKKHDWNTWENYLRVHESVLRKFSSHVMTVAPKYTVIKFTENFYQLSLNKLELKSFKGTVIQVNIDKDVEVQEGARKKIARTYAYSYQSWIKGGHSLLRYCSPHETHNQFHHKHIYHLRGDVLEIINDDSWPHVSEFLEELIHHY